MYQQSSLTMAPFRAFQTARLNHDTTKPARTRMPFPQPPSKTRFPSRSIIFHACWNKVPSRLNHLPHSGQVNGMPHIFQVPSIFNEKLPMKVDLDRDHAFGENTSHHIESNPIRESDDVAGRLMMSPGGLTSSEAEQHLAVALVFPNIRLRRYDTSSGILSRGDRYPRLRDTRSRDIYSRGNIKEP